MDRRKARIHPKQLTDETYKTKPGTFPGIPSQQKLLAGCKVSGPKNSIRRCRHANALSGPKLDHISCKPHMGFDLLRSQFFLLTNPHRVHLAKMFAATLPLPLCTARRLELQRDGQATWTTPTFKFQNPNHPEQQASLFKLL